MKNITIALLLTMAVLLCSCSPVTPPADDATGSTTTTTPTQSTKWEAEDQQTTESEGATVITLADNTASVEGDGVTVNGNVVTVSSAGQYIVRGSLTNGQLRVESTGSGTVNLVLDGVSIHSDTTAPLFVRKSDKTILTLAAGSQNILSDGEGFTFEDTENEEPSGTLFSKSDLVINGEGSLAVTAVFNDGIVSRDGLKIAGGIISVDAADDAVMGRDYVLIGDGELTLNATGDGVKSTNDAGEGVGYVTVEGGKLTVTSGKDGIQAESALTINGGDVTVTANGGSQNGTANIDHDFGWGMSSVDSSSDGKGLKAGTVLTMAGGTLNVDAADDAIHSNQTILMSGGNVTAAAGDDGLHADTALTVQNGTLKLTKSYEGLEAATITIDGGDLSITASDDGVNASSGSSETSGDRGMMQNPFMSDDSKFYINGGTLYVDAQGDGLDSNGSITMTGGEVYVVGPSNSGNGTFDYASAFEVTGGKLVAIGSSGMATTPTSNTMNNIVWAGFTMYDADDLTVTASDGTVIAQLEALRSANWMYVTCEELVTGDEVTVTCGLNSQTFTIEEGGNADGTAGGMHGGMPGGMGGGMGGPGGGMGRPGGFGW